MQKLWVTATNWLSGSNNKRMMESGSVQYVLLRQRFLKRMAYLRAKKLHATSNVATS